MLNCNVLHMSCKHCNLADIRRNVFSTLNLHFVINASFTIFQLYVFDMLIQRCAMDNEIWLERVRYEMKQRHQKSRTFFRFCISTLFEQMPKQIFSGYAQFKSRIGTYNYEMSYYVSKDNDGNNDRKITYLKI